MEHLLETPLSQCHQLKQNIVVLSLACRELANIRSFTVLGIMEFWNFPPPPSEKNPGSATAMVQNLVRIHITPRCYIAAAIYEDNKAAIELSKTDELSTLKHLLLVPHSHII